LPLLLGVARQDRRRALTADPIGQLDGVSLPAVEPNVDCDRHGKQSKSPDRRIVVDGVDEDRLAVEWPQRFERRGDVGCGKQVREDVGQPPEEKATAREHERRFPGDRLAVDPGVCVELVGEEFRY
jgi:hypothetical protein